MLLGLEAPLDKLFLYLCLISGNLRLPGLFWSVPNIRPEKSSGMVWHHRVHDFRRASFIPVFMSLQICVVEALSRLREKSSSSTRSLFVYSINYLPVGRLRIHLDYSVQDVSRTDGTRSNSALIWRKKLLLKWIEIEFFLIWMNLWHSALRWKLPMGRDCIN